MYFIECVENIRIFSTSENSDVFNLQDEIYLTFTGNKSKFSFYFILFIGYPLKKESLKMQKLFF